MTRKFLWLTMSLLMVLALVLVSCGPKTPETTPTTTPTTSATTTKPTTTPTTVPTSTAITTSPTTTPITKPAVAEVPRYGGTLTAAAKYDQDRGFDPFKYFVYAQHFIGTSVLEGMGIGDWAKGPAGTNQWGFGGFMVPTQYITGLLAESWEISPDALTYTVHLRKGVRFHNKPPANGRELTSADVKYCWDRRCGTGSGFTTATTWNMQDVLTNLKEITTPDKYTVVFQAKTFNYQLLQEILLGYYVDIYPPEVITAYGSMDEWKAVCGTGPFVLTDYVSASQCTMSKNPDYWRKDPVHTSNTLPYVDTYKILIIPDDATRLTAIRTGKADINLYAGLSDLDKSQLEKTMPYKVNFGKIFVGATVGIKFQMDAAPLNNLKVRQALYMAMDIKTIASIRGGDINGNTYASFCNNAFGPDIYTSWNELPAVMKDFLTYQPEKAKKQLADAGYPSGFTLTMLTSSTDPYMDIYEMVIDQWKKVGVTLKLEIVPTATRSARERVNDYQMTTTLPGTVGYSTTLNYVITGTMKPRYDDPYPVDQWNKAVGTQDEKARHAIFKALNVYLMENVFMYAPAVIPATYVVTQPWLGGYYGGWMLRKHDCSSIMPYIWINQALKTSTLK